MATVEKTRYFSEGQLTGSSNQRTIDVQKSLSTGKIAELNYLYENEKIVPRDRDFKKM